MSKSRKRKTRAKPPPVIADLFDVLEPPAAPTASETPAAPETPESVSSAAGDEGGRAGEAHGPGLGREYFESPIAVLEVLGFPAALVPGLPVAFTLRCELDGVPLVFTSARASYAAAREARVPAFVMRELVALAHAAQNDRVPPYVLASMLARKRETPELVIEPRYAFGGMPLANAEPSTCTIGEAFERMGVELVDVEVT